MTSPTHTTAAPCALHVRGGSAAPGAGSGGVRRLKPLCTPSRSQTDSSTVPTPAVEGPITGGKGAPFVAATSFDLAQVGYAQQEYFISGRASAYTNVGALGSNGRWKAKPADAATYKTRILVYRPTDAQEFSGTVFVEWLNVSGGLDAAPDWITAHTELIRKGHVWVGVSAQYVGVEGGSAILGQSSTSLKKVDPERYASLSHPGDSFSFDIFSQAGQAIRRPQELDPLGGLELERLIAIGESQSAYRLVTYVNAIDPLARVYDGFLIHSRGGSGASLSQAPQPATAMPAVARIRSDVAVPVLTFQTESDVIGLGYYPDRQSDGGLFRLWEVAGTAHADTYTLLVGFGDLGGSPDAAELIVTATPIPGIIECATPINSGPQHFVLKAAVAALERWVRDGTPPPRAPRLQVAGDPAEIARDEHGNALGGIRTPYVDVPIATLSGEGQTGGTFCRLFGTTTLFDDATLAALYQDHDTYVSAVGKAADRAVRAGFILKPDAELIKDAAAASDVGS